MMVALRRQVYANKPLFNATFGLGQKATPNLIYSSVTNCRYLIKSPLDKAVLDGLHS